MTKRNNFKSGIVITALLALIGLACWIMQVIYGLQLTNMNNFNSWALYIVCFVLFTGVGAGSLLFASSAWLFESLKEFRPYTRIASFVGVIGSVVAAGQFVSVDIGKPQRFWHMLTSLNLTSPLAWDMLILSSYVVIGLFFTWRLILVEQGRKDASSIKPVAVAAFVAGLLVTVTSFAFVVQVARPGWNNAGQTLSFLLAAIVAALCLLTIVFTALSRVGYIRIADNLLPKIGKLAALFLLVQLLFVLAETAIGLYAQAGEEYEVIHWLVAGPGAPFFYIELVALVLGIMLLAQGRNGLLVAGAVAAFFAIFMVKYNMIQAQLFHPLVSHAGPTIYTVPANSTYLPSFIELGVSLGIIGGAGLLVLLGLRYLNLGNVQNRVEKSVNV